LEPTAVTDRDLFYFTPEAAAADGDFFMGAGTFLEPTAAAAGDFFTGGAAFLEPTAAEDRELLSSCQKQQMETSSQEQQLSLHQQQRMETSSQEQQQELLGSSSSSSSSSRDLRVLYRGARQWHKFCQQFHQTSSLHQKP
jgi:hypothetical protein